MSKAIKAFAVISFILISVKSFATDSFQIGCDLLRTDLHLVNTQEDSASIRYSAGDNLIQIVAREHDGILAYRYTDPYAPSYYSKFYFYPTNGEMWLYTFHGDHTKGDEKNEIVSVANGSMNTKVGVQNQFISGDNFAFSIVCNAKR